MENINTIIETNRPISWKIGDAIFIKSKYNNINDRQHTKIKSKNEDNNFVELIQQTDLIIHY
jgi:hypothetical protein